MDEWKKKNLIVDYEEVKEGRTYKGIIFYTEETKKQKTDNERHDIKILTPMIEDKIDGTI